MPIARSATFARNLRAVLFPSLTSSTSPSGSTAADTSTVDSPAVNVNVSGREPCFGTVTVRLPTTVPL